MATTIGLAALAIYAVLLAAGGVMGYVKAGSRPSLIAGLGSALACAAAVAAGLVGWPLAALLAGLLIAGALTGVFLARWRKTGKRMPSGMLAIVSAGMAAWLAVLLLVEALPRIG